MEGERHVVLLDGTEGIVRPIKPSDGGALAAALAELDPDSRIRRFFFDKKRLSGSELARLSNPDGRDHVAYGLAVADGDALKPIAVARFFRDRRESDLAEIAMVTSDAWQANGAGAELMRSLTEAALGLGIRRWMAVMLTDNIGMRKLLDRFGNLIEERNVGNGVVENIYGITGPEGNDGGAACL
jgi:RimJ/RimL family protein N-acetyltransferase